MEQTNQLRRELEFKSAGTALFALEQGRGEPLIFLHGGLSDHRGALFRAGSLAQRFRLITPDVRAAGRSRFAGALSWDLLADDVAALLDALSLERAIVGGSSAGSAIALRFALRHPLRTRALVLVSPVYAGEEQGLNEAQRRAMKHMNEAGQRALTQGIEALVPLFEAAPEPVRQAALAMVRSFDPASVAATTRFLASAMQPFENPSDLAAVKVPALIVTGTDPEHPPELSTLYARWLPNAVQVEPTEDLAAALMTLLEAR